MESNKYYHIFNHANGSENLFREKENYYFFLKRYTDFIQPICKTYAYCLMPNHFHCLVQVRNKEDLEQYYATTFPKFKTLEKFPEWESFVTKQFSNFFSSYTQSFNKQYERRGSLFIKNFKRKEVSNENYFTKVIHYIHHNPVHHSFVQNMEDWDFSSYHSFLSLKKTLLERESVLNWFNNKEDFIQFHKQKLNWKEMDELSLEW